MVDSIQILLTVVISVLTVLLTIIGIAVFQILREFKGSLERINKMLDDTGRITESVAEPIESASDFIMGLKKGVSFLNNVSKLFKDKEEKKEIEEEALSSKPRDDGERKKFFTKEGRSLVRPS